VGGVLGVCVCVWGGGVSPALEHSKVLHSVRLWTPTIFILEMLPIL
jgi:hypothetical protein